MAHQHHHQPNQSSSSTKRFNCQNNKKCFSLSRQLLLSTSLLNLLLLAPSAQCLLNFASHKNRRGPTFAASPSSSSSLSSRRKFNSNTAYFSATTTIVTKGAQMSDAAETSTDDNVVRWGIVGLGDVTAIKSGPPFWKCRKSTLVAVMRRTPGAAQKWVDTYVPSNLKSKVTAYDDLNSFLSHSDLDAVYVATPPGSHLDVSSQVGKTEKLFCYVEKPVGRCGWETEQIIKSFQNEKKKNLLYTAYISRAYERTNAIQTLLEEGVVGDKVTSITYRLKGMGGARGMNDNPWRLDASKSGGGLIMDVGCHVIDRIDYLFGPLVKVNGEAKRRSGVSSKVNVPLAAQVEDYVSMTANIGTCDWPVIDCVGAKVDCVWDFCNDDDDDKGISSPPMDELVISGPNGSLKMAAMSPSLPISVIDMNGNVVKTVSFEQPEHTAQNLIQLVTDEISASKKGEGDDISIAPSRGENALRTSKVLDIILSGYYGGREDAFWARPETWPGWQQH